MDKTNNAIPDELAPAEPMVNKTEQIPKSLVFGSITLFIVFIIASVILAIWLPKFAWIPLVFFLFVFSSTVIIYFFIRINRNIINKNKEDLQILRKSEANLLDLVKIKIDDTIKSNRRGVMDKVIPVMETPLHPSAQDEILEIAMEDTERLIMQSKIVASKSNSPAVLSNHVKQAYSYLTEHAKDSKARDGILILGSTFLGAFLPGFIESVQTNNTTGIVIWVIVGIIGIILTMFGLWGMK